MPTVVASGSFDGALVQAIALRVHDLAGSDVQFAYMTQCMDAFGFLKVVISGILSMPSASVEEIAQEVHDSLIKHQLDHMKGGTVH